MEHSEKSAACIVHLFQYPASVIFEAFLAQDQVGKWMFSPLLMEQKILHVQIDPRVGGAFSFLVERQGKQLDHIGKYLKINRPHQLSFTWGLRDDQTSSLVEIEFAEQGMGTEVTLTHQLAPGHEELIKKVGDSWRQMLNQLATLLLDQK